MLHLRSFLLTGITACVGAAMGCSSNAASPTVSDAGDGGSSKTKPSGDANTSTKDTGPSDKTDAGGPPSASGPATTSSTLHNLAIHRLYVGDTDPTSAFTADTSAWKQFGYNLDGLITTAASTDVCTPFKAGSTAQQVDGNNGIDNAFGSQIVSGILQQLGQALSRSVSGAITSGGFTLEFDTDGLTTANGTSTQTAQGLSGQLFTTTPYVGTPALTGSSFAITDDWPLGPSIVQNASAPFQSRVQFPKAYVTNGTWVSGAPTTFTINLSIKGQTLALEIHGGVVTIPISADATGQLHGTGGIISGVLRTDELVTSLNTLAGGVGTPPGQYCPVVTSLLPDFENASDIIIDADGTVSNEAGTACNGISIGLGFDADEIAQPTTIGDEPDAAAPTPCGSGSGN